MMMADGDLVSILGVLRVGFGAALRLCTCLLPRIGRMTQTVRANNHASRISCPVGGFSTELVSFLIP